MSGWASGDQWFGTMSNRIPESVAPAISSFAWLTAPIPISMFDCPEQSQTSPIMTSSSRSVLEPMTFNTNGPPAFMAGKTACHSPRSFATAEALPEPTCTLIFSLGSAQPQTVMGFSRCNTM